MAIQIGASEVAAILGLDPFRTAWEIWAEKTGRLEPAKPTEAMDLGRRLETSILDWAEEILGPLQRGVEIAIPKTPIVCHPDALTQFHQPVEAKTAGLAGPYVGDWGSPGTDEIPQHYLVQVLVQLAATGADRAYVPALIGGRGLVMYIVDAHPQAQRHIIQTVCDWWRTYVVNDVEPPRERQPDLELLARLKRQPGKTVSVDPDLVNNWLAATERVRQLRAQLSELQRVEEDARRRVIEALGDAEIGCLPDGSRVVYREVRRRQYTVPESVYRVLRFEGPSDERD